MRCAHERLALSAGTAPGFAAGDDPFTVWTPFALFTRALFEAAGWCWVLPILGLLDRPRNGTAGTGGGTAGTGGGTAGTGTGAGGRDRILHRALRYGALAALPWYVLHQPVVVAVAYGVVGWSVSAAVKYTVIVVSSLAVIFTVHEYGVRRTRATRFLFGMHTASPARSVAAATRTEPPPGTTS
ncbi:hypothetical protein ACFP51_28215 [Streptomyces pratens]|uniref:Acyltransferase 3 domain-containing protein n=1 Tax=Streptomyces pratens TaxID=887456 RepID=A0ABW1LSD4_9ACTN